MVTLPSIMSKSYHFLIMELYTQADYLLQEVVDLRLMYEYAKIKEQVAGIMDTAHDVYRAFMPNF